MSDLGLEFQPNDVTHPDSNTQPTEPRNLSAPRNNACSNLVLSQQTGKVSEPVKYWLLPNYIFFSNFKYLPTPDWNPRCRPTNHVVDILQQRCFYHLFWPRKCQFFIGFCSFDHDWFQVSQQQNNIVYNILFVCNYNST